jgi:PAS domain S-box-containing protein
MVPVTLDDVLITDELNDRPSRDPDYRLEADAGAALGAALASGEGDALQTLTDTIIARGIAESAGVSLRRAGADATQCFWRAVSGRWRAFAGTSIPLDKTPCSIVIARRTALLFRDPGRYFSEPAVTPDIHEILMVPLIVDGDAVGSIWAVSHGADRCFEREDVRLLLRLGTLAAVAWRLETRLARTEQARAGASADLKTTQERLRQLVEGVPLLLWRAADTGNWTWASPQWTQLTGQSRDESLGQGWLEPVHPDDRRRARQAWRQAKAKQAFEVDYRLYDRATGEYRWFQTRASPVREADGTIVEWLGTSSDIDDLQRLREHERKLLAELQHRVRNALAAVRSIARRTIERSDTIETFQLHFDGRLGAFARAQALAARDPNAGVDLEALIVEELFVHQAREGERLTIAGPPVRLSPKIAEALGLAIHELAINAVKYGGLSSSDGYVEIRWRVDGSAAAPLLALTWRDSVPGSVAMPSGHAGFGRELIERSLTYELGASTALTIGPDGAHCDIRVPLD